MESLVTNKWSIDDLRKILDGFGILDNDSLIGYLELRKQYNLVNKNTILLYGLITSSFSNQIRFNRKGEFNLPYGKRYFNPQLQEHLGNFKKFISTTDKSIHLTNLDFEDVVIEPNSFVYLDPPYLTTNGASYSENKGWTQDDDNRMFKYLDMLNDKNTKFAMSNTFKNSGKENVGLIEWSKNYTVNYLDRNYSNASANKIDRSKSIEVLITNY